VKNQKIPGKFPEIFKNSMIKEKKKTSVKKKKKKKKKIF